MADAVLPRPTGSNLAAGRAYHHGNLKMAAIEAAVTALAQKMPSEITLRDLAKAIGVNHSALYGHFADRDELFAMVSLQGFERLQTEMAQALAEPGDHLDLLVEAYLHFARTRPAYYRAMFRPNNMAGAVAGQIEALCYACMGMLLQAVAAVSPMSANVAERRATAVWCSLHGLITLAGPDGPLRFAEPKTTEHEIAVAAARAIATTG